MLEGIGAFLIDDVIGHFPRVIDHFPDFIDHFRRVIDHFVNLDLSVEFKKTSRHRDAVTFL